MSYALINTWLVKIAIQNFHIITVVCMYAFHQTFSPILCLSSLTFTVKKEGFGGGGTRQLQFSNSGQGDAAFIKPSGKTLNVAVGPGLPPSTSMYL